MEDLTIILRQHPFLRGLSDEHMQTLIGCATNVRFAENSRLINEGELANKFFLVRSGRVALETEVSGRGGIRIQTVGPGEVLGWSWLISPYRWHFSGVAVMDTRAIALDAECLRKKCETDAHFGYEMLKRLASVMERRLEATRLQLLDMYGITSTGVMP
ncbi:cyclic nucleotide-binding domain-containing protein [Sphingobacteriales bacterium CHB3]|nr:cyclic nucleotide-binding domain-containing protein [Sphingobacteriales bacterium CHB3]